MSDIPYLAPEVLIAIFSHLDACSLGRVAQVCSRWRNAVYDRSLWQEELGLITDGEMRGIFYKHLNNLGIRRVKVAIDEQSNHLSMVLNNLAMFVPALISVEVVAHKNSTPKERVRGQPPGNNWKSKEVAALQKMEFLTCLTMPYNITKSYVPTANLLFESVTTTLNNLLSLKLYGCQYMSDASLHQIASNMPLLRRLELLDCHCVTNAGIGMLCGWDGRTDGGARPRLEHLALHNATRLTDVALAHLGRGQDGVTSLTLNRCRRLTDESLVYLNKLSNLCRLHLVDFNLSNHGLATLCDVAPKIIELDISHSPFVNDRGMMQLARLPHLSKLVMADCVNVSEFGLVHLCSGKASITSLDVRGCPGVKEKGLLRIAATLFQLRFLALDLDHLTEGGFLLAGHNLHNLHTLLVEGRNRMCDVLRALDDEQNVIPALF